VYVCGRLCRCVVNIKHSSVIWNMIFRCQHTMLT